MCFRIIWIVHQVAPVQELVLRDPCDIQSVLCHMFKRIGPMSMFVVEVVIEVRYAPEHPCLVISKGFIVTVLILELDFIKCSTLPIRVPGSLMYIAITYACLVSLHL